MENSIPSKKERFSEVMLKQKIIHLNSELSKYKALVKDFRESYQYSRVEKLIEENKKLIEMVDKFEKLEQSKPVVNENLIVQTVENEPVVNENLIIQTVENEPVVNENLIVQNVEYEKSADIKEEDSIQNDEDNSLITIYQEKIAQYEKKEKQWKKALKKMKSIQEENERLIRINEELTDKLENEEEYYHNLLVRVSRLNSDLYNANQREEELQNQLSTLQYRFEKLQANSKDNEND
jgi:hypothetical protein